MTIQSQLDQVLAPCPFCGRAAKVADSAVWFVYCPYYCAVASGGSEASAIAAWNTRAAVGGEAVPIAWLARSKDTGLFEFADPHEKASNPAHWTDAFPVYASQPVAVGGEAVGWQYLDAADDEWRETLCPNVWRDADVPVRAIYASPPATVDVGALAGFLARLRERRHTFQGAMPLENEAEDLQMRAAIAENTWISYELAALIGKEA